MSSNADVGAVRREQRLLEGHLGCRRRPRSPRYLCTRRIAPKTTRNTASNIIGAHQAAKSCRPQAETCARRQTLTVRVSRPVASSVVPASRSASRVPSGSTGSLRPSHRTNPSTPGERIRMAVFSHSTERLGKVTHSEPPRAYPVLMHIIPTDLRHFVPFHFQSP